MRAKLIKLLKNKGVNKHYGCECHSVEKLADEILATLGIDVA